MRIHTFTMVCGTKACNAACSYCVSKTESEDPNDIRQ